MVFGVVLFMVLLCGEQGILIYNVVYVVFVGVCYLDIFGMVVIEVWLEIVEFNVYVVCIVFIGQMLVYYEFNMVLY